MTSLEDGASPIISAKMWALICRFESQAVTNTFLLCHTLINSLNLKCCSTHHQDSPTPQYWSDSPVSYCYFERYEKYH